MEKSKGEKIIGSFNPSGNPQIEKLKQDFANLIDQVDALEGNGRCKSVSITHIQTAKFFAVDSLFSEDN